MYKLKITSTRQISSPADLPAFANAGCITVGLVFLFPCVLAAAGAITPVVRPPTVAPKQSLVNDTNNSKLLFTPQNNKSKNYD